MKDRVYGIHTKEVDVMSSDVSISLIEKEISNKIDMLIGLCGEDSGIEREMGELTGLLGFLHKMQMIEMSIAVYGKSMH